MAPQFVTDSWVEFLTHIFVRRQWSLTYAAAMCAANAAPFILDGLLAEILKEKKISIIGNDMYRRV